MPVLTSDVVVVGAGLIGLATAWRLAADGVQVTICDPTPGAQTSNVAAGMLAPVTEVEYGEDDLLALNLASVNAWPASSPPVRRHPAYSSTTGTRCTLVRSSRQPDRGRHSWAACRKSCGRRYVR